MRHAFIAILAYPTAKRVLVRTLQCRIREVAWRHTDL